MIDLSKNINPYYPNKNMIRYLRANINEIQNYPEKFIKINKKIKNNDITCQNVLITNGTLAAMDLILKTIKEKKVGYISPTFWGINEVAKKNNYEIISLESINELTYSSQQIKLLAKKVDVLYLCNNNNPTLSYLEKEELYKIIKSNPKCTFIIDESVFVFSEKFNENSMINYVNSLENLNVLVSCSKIFSVCGLRLGILFTNDSNKIKYMNNMIPYSTHILGSNFINKFFIEFNNLSASCKKIKNNFKFMINKIQDNPKITIIKSIIENNGSFVLIELFPTIDYSDIVNYLFEKGIKISPINNQYCELKSHYLRISAGRKKDYIKFIKVLEKYSELFNAAEKEKFKGV